METFLTILVDLVAIIIIAIVLLQPSERAGLGAIAGGAEQFLGKNRAKGFEEKMALITKVAAVVFFVLLTVLLIIK